MQIAKSVACSYDSIIKRATSTDDNAGNLSPQLTEKYDMLKLVI
jgi:hypothetical protein